MSINNVNDLRPVEALYLLSEAKVEKMDRENSLAAVLAYFSSKGLFKKREEKLFTFTDKLPIDVSDKIHSIRTQLREYELEIIKSIENDNAEKLMNNIEHFDFKKFFAENNLFDTKREGFLWKHNVYTPNKKNNEIVEELLNLRQQISDTIKNKSLDKDMLAMSYAFPNEQFDNKTTDIAHEIKNIVEEIELIRNSAIIAASTATTVNLSM